MKTILVLVSSIAVSLTFVFTVFAVGVRGPNPPAGEYSDHHRMIFYAVLEGCYEDGLTNEDIDIIIPKNERGGRKMNANFVHTCPLCQPAFDAFSLYASREKFDGQKVTKYNTFGPGLDDETKKQLRAEPKKRRKAIQGLISRWVEKRADLLRLTKEERSDLQGALKEMKEKGDEALSKFQKYDPGTFFFESYKDWEGCPICEGAVGAKMSG